MKKLSIISALAIGAMLAVMPGCDNAPPKNVPAAHTNTTPAKKPLVKPMPEPTAKPAQEAAKPAEKPAAKPAEKPAETAAATPAASGPMKFEIAPNDTNTIGFIGYKISGKKQGAWTDYKGTVDLPDGKITSAKINITFQMKSMMTSSKLLTDTLHNESWFNIAKFPTATFTSTKVEKGDGDDTYNVTGDLVIRGKSVNVTFPAKIEIKGDTLKTQAEFTLKRSDWGMVDTGLADDLIKDDVLIQFDVTAKKA